MDGMQRDSRLQLETLLDSKLCLRGRRSVRVIYSVMVTFRTKLAVLVAMLACALSATVGDATPNLELRDLQGGKHMLADYHGKPVVLNFWATWCVPCAAEMPLLSEMQNRYKDKVLFIAASVDEDDVKPEIAAFIKKHKGDALTVMTGPTLDSLHDFGLAPAMPGTVFIDAEGNIVDRVSGALKRPDLEQRLRKLTGEQAVKQSQPSAPNAEPSFDDREWLRQHYAGILDQLMPMTAESGWYLSYRSRRSLYTEVLEYGFFIGHEPRVNEPGLQEFLSAHVYMADTVSIYDQLMKMHQAKPDESGESIQRKLKVKTWTLTEKTCPAIQEQFSKFKKVNIQTPAFDEIAIHPLIHQFHIETGVGNMDIELDGSDQSLVLWALETRKALEACATSSGPTRP